MSKNSLPPKLNICLTAKNFPMQGRSLETSYLWQIATSLASKGHRVSILSNDSPLKVAEIEQDGIHAYFLSYLENASKTALEYNDQVKAQFAELHRNEPFHIVHSFDDSAFKIAKYRDKYLVPVVFDIEATHMSQLFSILGMEQESVGSLLKTNFAVVYKFLRTYFGHDRELLKFADGVFVASPQQRVFLERYYLFPDSKTFTVSFGIQITNLATREPSQEIRQKLNLNDDNRVVMTITDMSEVAEVANLLEAFQKLVVKKPDCRLVILGNGPKRKEIEYEMYNLALGNKVLMPGAIKSTDVSDYISICEVFANISSRTSGFDMNILDAMAQKKVVIGSEMSALATLIEDAPENRDGFLVRPADNDYLASLLIDLFSGDIPSIEIGDRARRKVIDFFDAGKILEETISSYYRVLRRTGYYKSR